MEEGMIGDATRAKIKGHLEGFIESIIRDKLPQGLNPRELRVSPSTSKKGQLKPFHESLLPEGLLAISEFERSFSTKLGTSFEECAKLVAAEFNESAKRGFRVRGQISVRAVRFIENAVADADKKGLADRTFHGLADRVASLSSEGEVEDREVISDLYVERKDVPDLYIELKSPKPNKGQCLEAIRRQLMIHGIKGQGTNEVRAYFASAYNPYGLAKDSYKHSFACRHMDMAEGVLIGKEFWDLVGGAGAYEEVLAIYQEVGREKGPGMLDQLALGY